MFKKIITTLLITCLTFIYSYSYAVDNISVAFSPDDGAEQLVLDGIESAEKSIKVAAYAFTSSTVSLALLKAYNEGVTVQVVADAGSAKGKYSAVSFLANHGIPVRLNDKYAIFHHKFMVIDDKHVETGSYNYSSAAAHKNAENVIILWNAPKVAKIYSKKWTELWDEGNELLPAY